MAKPTDVDVELGGQTGPALWLGGTAANVIEPRWSGRNRDGHSLNLSACAGLCVDVGQTLKTTGDWRIKFPSAAAAGMLWVC